MSISEPRTGSQDAPLDYTLPQPPLSTKMRAGLINRVEELKKLRGDTERPRGWVETFENENPPDGIWEEAERLDMEAVTILHVLRADDPDSYTYDLAHHLLNLFLDFRYLKTGGDPLKYAADSLQLQRTLRAIDPATYIHAFAASLQLIRDHWGWYQMENLCPEVEGIFVEAGRVAQEKFVADPVMYSPQLIAALRFLGETLQYAPQAYPDALNMYMKIVRVAQEEYAANSVMHASELINVLNSAILNFSHWPSELYPTAHEIHMVVVYLQRALYTTNHVMYCHKFIDSLQTLGYFLKDCLELYPEAEAAYLEAIKIARELFSEDPVTHRSTLTDTLQYTLRICWATRVWPIELSQTAQAIFSALGDIPWESYITTPDELIDFLNFDPLQYLMHGQSELLSPPPETQDVYLKAVKLARELSLVDPVKYGSHYAEYHRCLIRLMLDYGWHQEALDMAYQHIEALKPLAYSSPDWVIRQMLLHAFRQLGKVFEEMGRDVDILEVDEESSVILNRSSDVQRLPGPKLGSGAFGSVYLAEGITPEHIPGSAGLGSPLLRVRKERYLQMHLLKSRLEGPLVVKILNEGRYDDASALLDFSSLSRNLRRELLVSYRLGTVLHENIVQHHGYVIDKGSIGLVSTYFSGGNVMEYLKSDPSRKKYTSDLCRDVACGLLHLHALPQPIIHGDLKPANVVVSNEGLAALCDFGLSRLRWAISEPPISQGDTIPTRPRWNSGLTATSFCGTLRYCGPELLQSDDAQPTPESDVYAFACTTGEILTGFPPFAHLTDEARIVDAIWDEMPPYNIESILLDYPEFSILAECWHADPTQRPTMDQICERMAWEKRSDEEEDIMQWYGYDE